MVKANPIYAGALIEKLYSKRSEFLVVVIEAYHLCCVTDKILLKTPLELLLVSL